MKFYIGECGSFGRQFDNVDDFLKALKDLAGTCKDNGADWFEVEVSYV